MAAAPPRGEALLCRTARAARGQLALRRVQIALAVCADLPFRADHRRADGHAGRAPAHGARRCRRGRGVAAAAHHRRARAPADGFVRQQLLYQPEDLRQQAAGHGFPPAGRSQNARRSLPDPPERKMVRLRSGARARCGDEAADVRFWCSGRCRPHRDALHAARAGKRRGVDGAEPSAVSARLLAAACSALGAAVAVHEPRLDAHGRARAARAARQPVFQLLCGHGDQRPRPRERHPHV